MSAQRRLRWWKSPVVLSLLLHGAALGAVFAQAPALRERVARSILVSFSPVEAPGQRPPAPAAGKAQASPRRTPPQRHRLAIPPLAPLAPRPLLTRAVAVDPDPPPPGPPSLATTQAVVAPATGHAPSPALMAGYIGSLGRFIGRHQRYPEEALQLALEGEVRVRLRVHKDGTLAAPPLVAHSCGHEVLDSEALQMVKRAIPLPPLPQDFPGMVAELLVPVRFEIAD